MNDQKIGVIVQARMGSSRLPGKILKKIYKNERVLDILIKRLKLSKLINELIIATTSDKKDSIIIEVSKLHNVSYFIGSKQNVLKRYYEAAKEFELDIIIRVCSDDPFVDPKILDDMIFFYKNNNYDYINSYHKSSNLPIGINFEIFSFNILEKIYSLGKTKADKEHVTYYIFTHPEDFAIYYYDLKDLKKIDGLRLTIDEKEDLIMCRKVYKKLMENGKSLDFSIYDVIEIIENNPEIIEINKQVKQREK